jgi:hypothetical protein
MKHNLPRLHPHSSHHVQISRDATPDAMLQQSPTRVQIQELPA